MQKRTRTTTTTTTTQTAPASATPSTQTAPASATPSTQTAPASVAPANTKYTRGLATHGANVGGLVAGNVASFAAIAVNGKPVFNYTAGTVWHKGPTARAPKPTTYAGTMWLALVGKPCAEGIASALVACAGNMGAVPPKYAASYVAMAAWLQGTGPQPPASVAINCAKHVQGYLQGYMLKAAHGGLVLR